MSQAPLEDGTVRLHVKNIGGIDETTVEFSPGVTVLTGRNATNRTSLLQALMAAIGGEAASVKGDSETGSVELTLDDTTYTRHLERRESSVVASGDPYLDDSTLADLFAFLLEMNEARQTVARSENLRDIIMDPVDTADIEARIERLQSERKRIDTRLEEISSLKADLPEMEGERAGIVDEIEAKREELAELEAEIDDIDADVSERREENEAFEAKLADLNDVRSELESVRTRLDSQRESLEALESEREELREELTDYEDIPEGRLDEIESEIGRLREQKTDVESTVDEIQTVIQFNEGLLEGDLGPFAELESDDSGSVTDQLLNDSEEIVCWTCGSEVDTERIESMLERLRGLRNDRMERRNDLESTIEARNDERIRIEEKQRQRRQIEDHLETVEEEISERRARIEDLDERKSELTAQVESLESEVETLQTDGQRDTELLDLHKEANRIEVEIDRLEADRDEVEARIEDVESRIEEGGDLEARRKEIRSEISDLQVRVEQTEQSAVEQFNEHMTSILDILEYDNLERIWIERMDANDWGSDAESRFELHIVRSTDSGAVYEDTIDHLSESEREVTGLVFALAGYLVHDVHEEVPFMLLDSMEAIDAPRLAELVDYFEEYADYLIVALLEGDAAALDDDYQRVTDI